MTWPFDRQDWFDLENEMQNTITSIIASTDVKYTENGLNDLVIYAATLLFRTLSAVRSVFELASKGFLVESNIIARSCVENVLWLRGLKARGMDFVQEILSDSLRADASLAELILAMPGISLDQDAKQLADAQIQAKAKVIIKLRDISDTSEAGTDYSVFRMLSNSHAHPSIRSLDRHLERSPETGAYTLCMDPEVSPHDLLWTMFLAAGTALTAVGQFLETFPADQQKEFEERKYGEMLKNLADRFRHLGLNEGLSGKYEKSGSS